MTQQVVAILTEIRNRGVELVVEGDRLRFRPKDRLTTELVDRLKACKGEVLTALSSKPDGRNPNSQEARTSDPATVDDLRAAKRSEALTGLLGDGRKVCGPLPSGAEGRGEARSEVGAVPKPCATCGNPIFWVVPTGVVACGNCTPRPDDVTLAAVVITLPDVRLAWEIEPVDAWKRRSK